MSICILSKNVRLLSSIRHLYKSNNQKQVYQFIKPKTTNTSSTRKAMNPILNANYLSSESSLGSTFRQGTPVQAPSLITATALATQLTNIQQLNALGDPLESAKRTASYLAVDTHFLPLVAQKYSQQLENASNANKLDQSPLVVGVGSGSTVIYCAERLGEIKKTFPEILNDLNLICISTGFQSKNLIIENGLRLGLIENYGKLDIAFDGADECDVSLNCIKGGGACLFQEKLVSLSSEKFVIVADYRKKVNHLGQKWSIPIEIVPNSYNYVANQLAKVPGFQKTQLRQGGQFKAGPVVTDNSNCILDVYFGEIDNPSALNDQLIQIVGIVETGLFPNINCIAAYFGNANGTVDSIIL